MQTWTPSLPATDDPATWLEVLGVPDAPIPRAAITAALDFFTHRMPTLKPSTRFGFLRAMDLHAVRPARQVVLPTGTVVIAYRDPDESPFKLFYSVPGTALARLAVNPSDRRFVRYQVTAPCTVLESTCAPARDDWSRPQLPPVLVSGGARQYIIPHAEQVLSVVNDRQHL